MLSVLACVCVKWLVCVSISLMLEWCCVCIYSKLSYLPNDHPHIWFRLKLYSLELLIAVEQFSAVYSCIQRMFEVLLFSNFQNLNKKHWTIPQPVFYIVMGLICESGIRKEIECDSYFACIISDWWNFSPNFALLLGVLFVFCVYECYPCSHMQRKQKRRDSTTTNLNNIQQQNNTQT